MAHTAFIAIPGVDLCNYSEINTAGGSPAGSVAYGELSIINFAIPTVVGVQPSSVCIENDATAKVLNIQTSDVLAGTNKVGIFFG